MGGGGISPINFNLRFWEIFFLVENLISLTNFRWTFKVFRSIINSLGGLFECIGEEWKSPLLISLLAVCLPLGVQGL
jgi:hypothetical protein